MNNQTQPKYMDSDETVIGVCWGCESVLLERIDGSDVQSAIQKHSKQMGHDVSVFDRTKGTEPGFGVHCSECGYSRRFDSRNTTTPERSAQSAKAGHAATGHSGVVQVTLYE